MAELLTGMGVPAAPEDVVTSSQAAARLLAERLPKGAPVLVVGSTALRHAGAGLLHRAWTQDRRHRCALGRGRGVADSRLAPGPRRRRHSRVAAAG